MNSSKKVAYKLISIFCRKDCLVKKNSDKQNSISLQLPRPTRNIYKIAKKINDHRFWRIKLAKKARSYLSHRKAKAAMSAHSIADPAIKQNNKVNP